jgi:hypothetical protein
MSSTATKATKVRYFLINKDYGGGLDGAMGMAFLKEINKRRGDVASEYFCSYDVRSDPFAIFLTRRDWIGALVVNVPALKRLPSQKTAWSGLKFRITLAWRTAVSTFTARSSMTWKQFA